MGMRSFLSFRRGIVGHVFNVPEPLPGTLKTCPTDTCPTDRRIGLIQNCKASFPNRFTVWAMSSHFPRLRPWQGRSPKIANKLRHRPKARSKRIAPESETGTLSRHWRNRSPRSRGRSHIEEIGATGHLGLKTDLVERFTSFCRRRRYFSRFARRFPDDREPSWLPAESP